MDLTRMQKILGVSATAVGVWWIYVQHQRGKKKSRSGEDCRMSADCAEDLGCFAGVCGTRSADRP